MEILVPIMFLIAVGTGIYKCMYPKPSEKLPYVITQPKQRKVKTKTKAKTKSAKSEEWKEAKNTLVTFGFSATEAKEMLDGVNASTAEQYVNQAMKRVKI